MTGRRVIAALRLCAMLSLLAAGPVAAAGSVGPELRIAVAANFAPVAERLCAAYHASRPGHCVISAGASGLLAAQVTQGAPFDVFLSADRERPERLVAEGDAVPASRRTYAIGRLALWAPGLAGASSIERVLGDPSVATLSIANPDTAPYGAAAVEVLHALGYPKSGRPRIVQGTNVAQAFQFVESRAADAGFVARSQLIEYAKANGRAVAGSVVDVPDALHAPIEQQAVLLSRAAANADAQGFLDYLGTPGARALIEAAGYGLPSP